MSDKKHNKGEEKRSYFRVDDVISVVASKIMIDSEKMRAFRESAASSKAFSLMDTQQTSEPSLEESMPDLSGNERLYRMMVEIKTKLDFLINHSLLEKEGVNPAEKKLVNISASGIRFTVDHPVNKGDVMEVKLLLPTYPPVAVLAYGEVMRVDMQDDKTSEVSLEYLNMDESVRNEIIQYTLSRQREAIRKMKEPSVRE